MAHACPWLQTLPSGYVAAEANHETVQYLAETASNSQARSAHAFGVRVVFRTVRHVWWQLVSTVIYVTTLSYTARFAVSR